MNKVESVCVPGNIAIIEQFTYAEEELRLYVIYTYYDKAGTPLYVGCSKSFYEAHYFNSERFSFFDEVEYVGFKFFEYEAEIKDARKYFIKARNPKYNQRKCVSTPLLPGLDPSCDDLVVYRAQMERRWDEWLRSEEEIDCSDCPFFKDEVIKSCFSCDFREGFFCEIEGDNIKLNGRCSEWTPIEY